MSYKSAQSGQPTLSKNVLSHFKVRSFIMDGSNITSLNEIM